MQVTYTTRLPGTTKWATVAPSARLRPGGTSGTRAASADPATPSPTLFARAKCALAPAFKDALQAWMLKYDLRSSKKISDHLSNDAGTRSLSTPVSTDWFTNHTFIPGEPTIPDDMYDANSAAAIEYKKRQKHPWSSPGTAPTFGEGCGANGGNPNGCGCKEAGPVNFCYGNDDRPYGSCCAQV